MRGAIALAALALGACTRAPERDLLGPAAAAQVEYSIAGDWPSANRDLAGSRFSPLQQIDTINVSDLREAWRYPLGDGSAQFELTPIVVGGVLYATTAERVVALRADTGAELWGFAFERGAPSRRGVAYWPGDDVTAARLFVTAGRRLLALDARSGLRVAAFGNIGEVDMPAPYNAAPTRFEDLLIVGSHAAPGGLRAFSARTGEQVWEFAPEPAAPLALAHAFTVDVDRGIVYVPFASAGADDYYGGERSDEEEVFGSAVVALDARTGTLRWHFQTVRHDIWNYDLIAAPTLLDVATRAGVQSVVVQPAKTGYLYVLARATGRPLFGMADTPMSASAVPGERSAATQPIPVKPAPVARVSFAVEDLVTRADTTAKHAEQCRALRDANGGVRNVGPFTPYGYRAPGGEARASVVFPGASGGASWGGAAADPTLGFVFVNTTSEGSVGWIERNVADATAAQTGEGARRERLPYRRMSAAGSVLARFAALAEVTAPDAPPAPVWPCQKPPWGELVAVAAATGEIAWRVPLGTTPELPEARQKTGRPNRGGATATAGGLVLVAASDDRRLRAFASRTGEELWSVELPRSGYSVPVTYLAGEGKQYVVIVAGGEHDPSVAGVQPQSIIAYALP